MGKRIRTLAADDTGMWALVFIEEERQLFVGFATHDAAPSPTEGMTAEDFLVKIPKNALQQRAQHAFMGLLRTVTA